MSALVQFIGAVLRPPGKRLRRVFLGAELRDLEDIAADPVASPSEVLYLAESGPAGEVAAVQHPNCPFDLFLLLAGDYPIEAMNNVSFSMILLGNLEQWQALERAKSAEWVNIELTKKPALVNKFNADCIERVLRAFSGFQKTIKNPLPDFLTKILQQARYTIDVLREKRVSVSVQKLLNSLKPFDDLVVFDDVAPNSAGVVLRSACYWSLRDFIKLRKDEARGGPTAAAVALANLRAFESARDRGELRENLDDEDSYRVHDEELFTENVLQWHHLLKMLAYQEKYSQVLSKVKSASAALFRESYYGPEASRETAVREKIRQATNDFTKTTKQIVEIMERSEGWGWPDYLIVGVAVGGLILVIVAPELFIVEGVAEMYTFAAARSAAATVAEQIAALSVRAEISAATFELNKLAAATAAETVFLKELAVKLQAAGVAVKLGEAVEVVIKVVR